jgi:hypothetical protein
VRRNKRRTAIHEAGHAVIGRVLRFPCGPASIVVDVEENEAGHAMTGDQWETWTKWYVDDAHDFYKRGKLMRSIYRGRILVFMSGAEAEKVFFGKCRGGDGDDQYRIMCMADDGDAEFTPELWARYEPRMRKQTRRLIRYHRDKIEHVADALLKHETLQGAEIDAILEGKADGMMDNAAGPDRA